MNPEDGEHTESFYEAYNDIFEYLTESFIVTEGDVGRDLIPSRCHLRLFKNPSMEVIAIMREIKENIGASVTNSAQTLAEDIVDQFNLQSSDVRFFEHYDKNSYLQEGEIEERFAEIKFEWDHLRRASNAEWSYITKEDLENLLNEG